MTFHTYDSLFVAADLLVVTAYAASIMSAIFNPSWETQYTENWKCCYVSNPAA